MANFIGIYQFRQAQKPWLCSLCARSVTISRHDSGICSLPERIIESKIPHMQETERVETFETGVTEESNASAATIVSEPAALVTPVDNPVARTAEPKPAVEPAPLMEEPDSAGKMDEIEEEMSRLK